MAKIQIAIMAAVATGLALADRPHPRYPSPAPSYPPTPAYPSPPEKHPSYPQPHYPPPKPHYAPYYEEVCKLKEWSTDTELCKPGLAPACEQQGVKVLKITKPKPECTTVKIPKCKTTNAAEEVEVCSFETESKEQELYAKLFETEDIKRCDTHYTTECKQSYGSYKPSCNSVPVQNCYDVPILKHKNVPVKVKATEVKDSCRKELVPTPKTICWEEEVELCTAVPELKEKDEHLNKCTLTLSEEECEKVRLTIPRELCFHVQKYHQTYPYAQ